MLTRHKTTAPVGGVEVAATLDGLAKLMKQKLYWRSRCRFDEAARSEQLPSAQAPSSELHYPGNPKASAAMNIWLHKQAMTKLAENCGKVPTS